jgi:hypothetical protein
MKAPALLIGGSVLAVGALGLGTCSAVGAVARAERTEVVAFTEPITAIRVSGDVNDLRLVGADIPTVTGARTELRGWTEPTVSERVVGGVLLIDVTCPWFLSINCGAGYSLQVPSGISLELSTSGGDVRVEAVDGQLDIDSSGGGITVIDASGRLSAESSGGRISIVNPSGPVTASSSGGDVSVLDARSTVVDASSSGGGVRVEFVTVPDDVRADSSGGGVRVVVPGGVAYAVDADSSGGSTTVDVATDSASPHRIRADSSGGNVRVTNSP